MLDSTKDLLYIVLSLAVLWFTIFLCWLLYQAARILRNANNIIESITEKLELITDAMHFVKEKVDKMSGVMGIMNSAVGELAEKFIVGKLTKKFQAKVARKKRAKKK